MSIMWRVFLSNLAVPIHTDIIHKSLCMLDHRLQLVSLLVVQQYLPQVLPHLDLEAIDLVYLQLIC